MSLYLVTGATGRLGRLVTGRLLEEGVRVRVLTRRPQAALALFGERVEIASGDFADPASLHRAVSSVHGMLLLSPIGETLARDQTAAIDAARGAGVGRIVKISGSHWTIVHADRSRAGRAHAQIERHLGAQNIEHAVLRPNAWMQVGLAAILRDIRRTGQLVDRYAGAAVSFIDARDIADVAVRQLLHPVARSPLVLTGSRSCTVGELAELLAPHLARRPLVVAPNAATGVMPVSARPDFEALAVAEFAELIAQGHAASTTDTVRAVLGMPPRSVADFVAQMLDGAGDDPAPIQAPTSVQHAGREPARDPPCAKAL